MLDQAISDRAPAAPHDEPGGETQRSRTLGVETLQTLLRLGVSPDPRNYELWHTHLSGARPELSRRIEDLIALRVPFTGDVLDALHDAHFAASDPEADAVGAAAGEVEKNTQAMLDQIAATQGPLQAFGASLATWPERIRAAESLSALDTAVASLGLETSRILDDNRRLQDRLDSSVRRIDGLRQTMASLRTTATTDSLTGLLNRRAVEGRLKRAMGRADAEPCTVLLADIDHFKQFNDLHGHTTGDLVLRLVARLMTEHTKGRDAVGRFGGEEFIIVMAGADQAGGESVARQICEAISAKPLVTAKTAGRMAGRITLSVGVAQHRPGEKMSALIERADMALYAAKHGGRNRVIGAKGAEGRGAV